MIVAAIIDQHDLKRFTVGFHDGLQAVVEVGDVSCSLCRGTTIEYLTSVSLNYTYPEHFKHSQDSKVSIRIPVWAMFARFGGRPRPYSAFDCRVPRLRLSGNQGIPSRPQTALSDAKETRSPASLVCLSRQLKRTKR